MSPQLFGHRIRTTQNDMMFMGQRTNTVTATTFDFKFWWWLWVPAGHFGAFSPPCSVLTKVSDKASTRTELWKAIDWRGIPKHGGNRIFKKNRNTTRNSTTNDPSSSFHGGIPNSHFSTLRLGQIRKTIDMLTTTKGTPSRVFRASTRTAPSGIRCSKPDATNAPSANPAFN